MDPITHGLTGALIGKALFAGGPPGAGAQQTAPLQGRQVACAGGRAAIWICVLAAMFPDVDVFFEPFVQREMATLELHRGVTHSLVCLPAFTALMTTVTWWWLRRRASHRPPGLKPLGAEPGGGGAEAATHKSVSWGVLAGMWAAGIGSHIVLDLATSWGTMVWAPLANTRVTWDWVFIIDFVLTGIILLPQVVAWVYARPQGALARAAGAWAAVVVAAWGVQALAGRVNVPFSAWTIPAVAAILAAALCGPLARGWGFTVSRAAWCRAGLLAMAGYYGVCAWAHGRALAEVEAFARGRGLQVEALGALPMPPAAVRWLGLIRTPEGVYRAYFSVLENPGPEFALVADERPPESYRSTLAQLEEVRTYLWFARFPVVRYRTERGRHVVEFFDLRFFPRDASTPAPFQYRVVMNEGGEVLEQGWVED